MTAIGSPRAWPDSNVPAEVQVLVRHRERTVHLPALSDGTSRTNGAGIATPAAATSGCRRAELVLVLVLQGIDGAPAAEERPQPLTRRMSPLTSNLGFSRSYLGGLHWRLVAVGPVRWGAAAPWRAARAALGVVVPLAVGAASGHLDYGAFAALGAMPGGFASFQGVSRGRIAAVALASGGMAVSTFVGATTAAAAPWLLVVVVIVWGYVMGLAVCLGPRLSVAILQWGVSLMIAVGLPLAPAPAGVRAGLVLAGGLLQGLLVAGSWVVRPGDAERRAMADSYRELSVYAGGVADGSFEPPSSVAFPAAAVLEDPNPLLREVTYLTWLDLLEEAERVRASLAALAARAAATAPAGAAQLRRLSADAAAVLDVVAASLAARRRDRIERARELTRRAAAIAVPTDAVGRPIVEALSGQLRAVARLVGSLAESPPEANRVGQTGGLILPHETDGTAVFAMLRANASLASEAGRHALRLAVAGGLAEVIVLATGLRDGRWVVLTLFLVLKPDYGTTVYRSVQRGVGTGLGVALGAAAAQVAHLGRWEPLIVAGVIVAAAYALFDVAYPLYSVAMSMFIVVLLDILGTPAVPTAAARVVDTAIGAALALIAYFAWPTWEAASARETFARLVETHAEYGAYLLRQLAYPGRLDAGRLRNLQVTARRARSDAEASAARLSEEPQRASLRPQLARVLIATVRRLVQAELALHVLAPLQQVPAADAREVAPSKRAALLDRLASALTATMSELARSLRTMQPAAAALHLRQHQVELAGQANPEDSALVNATDSLVDAVDTLHAVLRDHLVSPKECP
ncbi:MAG: hypothetical protein JWO17_1768 [Actinomycetia bacterium]|nr:hypothetical protein [Actinomycetes bacterium]